MTQRERPTPDAGHSAPACATRLWDDLFHRASPDQQHDLLALAARQGVVYAHQIAVNGNSTPPRRTLLPALLNGQTKDLEAVQPPLLEPLADDTLDSAQREAIARAVQTPDLCAIQGTCGTGKSRVIAEIVLQAVRRGDRVLFVAPAAAALDRVLEQLAGNDALCPVRCVTPDDALPALPACIRRLTFAERQRYFQEYTLPAAHRAAETARQRCTDSGRLEPLFAELDAILTIHRRLRDEHRVLSESWSGIAAAVASELTDPSAPLHARRLGLIRSRDEAVARIDAQLAVLLTDQEKNRTEIAKVAQELQPLAPLLEARQHNRWWSGAWWRARKEMNLPDRVAELQARQKPLEQQGAALAEDVAKLQAQRRQADEQLQAAEKALADDETARRQAEADACTSALLGEITRMERDWPTAVGALEAAAPSEMTPAALQTARDQWTEKLHAEQRQRECAESWEHGVADALATLPQRLAACANVVAAITTGLAQDPYFGDRSATTFDLLILDEAEQVTESEFVNVARRANRWVLVGQPMPDVDGPAAIRRTNPAKPLRPAALRPGFFQRLWNTLHGDPRRLPYAWARRDGRLSCCLHAIPQDHLQWVEKEHVADRPDIELCIVAPPRRPSYLAEVVFPAAMTIHEAKEYIFCELGELSVQAGGHSLRWCETSDRIVLKLSAADDPDAVPVALEPGVCELVGPLPPDQMVGDAAPWHTCGLAFDREAGWTRERAVRWVETHLKTRDLGRTAYLATPYRMHARLAQVLDDLLLGESHPLDCPRYAGLSSESDGAAPMEFVAVPAGFSDGEPRRRTESDGGWSGGGAVVAAKPRTVKGGAGFEIDLADPRRLDPLPAELRPLLPAVGLVNFLEAQAVVTVLERLVSDPALQSVGANHPAAPCARPIANGACPAPASCSPRSHCPVVAVVALYHAQAALLSLLIQRSPILAASDLGIEVGPPAAFRQRECHVALVSLTRSHAHRAVSFGDGPQALAQALTRATARVVLFGDPGTLLRRSQWPSELDHLEEADALKERDLTARLVRYIQGQGAHAPAFHLREGSGT